MTIVKLPNQRRHGTLALCLAASCGVVLLGSAIGCRPPPAPPVVSTVSVGEARHAPAKTLEPGKRVEPTGPTSPTSSTSPEGAVRRFRLDPARSRVGFIGTKRTGSHVGGFHGIAGTIALVGDELAGGQIDVAVDAGSLFASPPKLAAHLRTADFLDVERFPRATFRSTRVENSANGLAVTGELTIRDVIQTISFEARVTRADGALHADAEPVIHRRAFGIDYPGLSTDPIDDEVRLVIALVAVSFEP